MIKIKALHMAIFCVLAASQALAGMKIEILKERTPTKAELTRTEVKAARESIMQSYHAAGGSGARAGLFSAQIRMLSRINQVEKLEPEEARWLKDLVLHAHEKIAVMSEAQAESLTYLMDSYYDLSESLGQREAFNKSIAKLKEYRGVDYTRPELRKSLKDCF